MPPSTDQVQSSTNQYRLILTQFLQVLTSSALYWPSATKYQPAFERISTCRSFLNLTTYKFISGVEFDQGYLSFFTQKLLLEPVFDGNIAFLWACKNKTLFLDLWYIGDRGCGHLRWKRHGTVSKSFLPNRIPYQIYHLIGFDTKLSTACTACRMWTQGGHLESPALRSSSSPHSALWPSASCLSSLGEDLCSHHYTIYKVCIRPVHKNLFLEFPKYLGSFV